MTKPLLPARVVASPDEASRIVSQLPAHIAGAVFYADGALFVPEEHAALVTTVDRSRASPALLANYAKAVRDRMREAGTAYGIPTDKASRDVVGQTIQLIDLGIMTAPVQWKLPTGYQPLERADLVGLAQAMAAHVQACFDVEAAALAGIAAGTLKTQSDIDRLPWPKTAE